MRVAFVVSNLSYPPVEGLHQQSIVTAQLLAGPGREVHLLGFVRDAAALDEHAMFRDTGLRFRQPPIVSRLPDILLGVANRLLPPLGHEARNLRARLPEYDIIHLENVGAVGLVRRGFARRAILGLVDPGTLRWARFAHSAKSARARWSARGKRLLHLFFEHLVVRPGTTVHLVSREDATYLRHRLPKVRVAAVPVALPPPFESKTQVFEADEKPRLLVFLDLRQPHLRRSFLWFAREVLARSKMAHISQLIVLGRVDADAELCAAVGDVDVTFMSWVEDYRLELAKATVIVTPDLVGTGLKNRVLQSMAVGRPVVGTTIAFEAIDIATGREAVSVDDPDRMAEQLDRLLADRNLCAAIGSAGREWVLRRFSADAVREQWNNLYDEVAGEAGKSCTG